MDALEILQKYWKHDGFRPGQEDIIQSVLSGQDTLALLPTGGGKSVCFQVPALMMEGTALVVSPLIALMTDQVNALKDKGIAAVAIHSALQSKDIDRIMDNATTGAYRFLYVSPERLVSEKFRNRLAYIPISILVVDEAHCVSQWGYDFRPPYLRIAEIRTIIGDCPVVALTATATPRVCDDIFQSLQFKKGKLIRQSFQRGNMHLIVRNETNKWNKLLDILAAVKGTAIIYVRSRKGTKEIADFLRRHRISAEMYHAGMKTEWRQKAQDDWLGGKTRVIVSTNAFGMGIDKGDVRLVLHWDLPDSLEAYYQEAGRAGRDGNICYAGIIFQEQDIDRLSDSIEKSYPDMEEIRKTYHALANYCQLASGAGLGQSFPFSHEGLQNFTNQSLLVINYSIRVLQQQGFIYLNESARNTSIVHITVDHETLYRFQIENKRWEPIIKAILRTSPGVFDEHVPIRETELAHFLHMNSDEVQKSLAFLQSREILVYFPAGDDPRVTFLTERYDSKELPLDKVLLKKVKEEAIRRTDAMLDYVTGKPGCRMQKILAYFGEESERCGMCDHCVEAGKHDLLDTEILTVYDWLSEILLLGPKEMKEILASGPPYKKEKMLESISYLIDNRWVSYNEQNQLEWIGKKR